MDPIGLSSRHIKLLCRLKNPSLASTVDDDRGEDEKHEVGTIFSLHPT